MSNINVIYYQVNNTNLRVSNLKKNHLYMWKSKFHLLLTLELGDNVHIEYSRPQIAVYG